MGVLHYVVAYMWLFCLRLVGFALGFGFVVLLGAGVLAILIVFCLFKVCCLMWWACLLVVWLIVLVSSFFCFCCLVLICLSTGFTVYCLLGVVVFALFWLGVLGAVDVSWLLVEVSALWVVSFARLGLCWGWWLVGTLWVGFVLG